MSMTPWAVGAAAALFDDLRLSFDGVKVYGTPRRLAIHVKTSRPGRPMSRPSPGPPASRAFDADGHPTKALKDRPQQGRGCGRFEGRGSAAGSM
jgi:glycyl-tRNA synthetase beta subunit